MKPTRRFLFDRCFSDADAAVEIKPAVPEVDSEEAPNVAEPPAPTFSAEDVAQAREDGRREAAIEAAGTAERLLAEQLDRLGAEMSALLAELDGLRAQAARDAVAVATAVARKIVPGLYVSGALDDIAQTTEAVMERLVEVPSLTVHVAEPLAEPLAQRLSAVAETHGLDGRVAVTADPSLTEGDCRIDWPNGTAQRSAANLWREIDAIIDTFIRGDGSGGEPEPPLAETDDDTDATTALTEDGKVNAGANIVPSPNTPPSAAGEAHG